jgi:hypothetical protein
MRLIGNPVPTAATAVAKVAVGKVGEVAVQHARNSLHAQSLALTAALTRPAPAHGTEGLAPRGQLNKLTPSTSDAAARQTLGGVVAAGVQMAEQLSANVASATEGALVGFQAYRASLDALGTTLPSTHTLGNIPIGQIAFKAVADQVQDKLGINLDSANARSAVGLVEVATHMAHHTAKAIQVAAQTVQGLVAPLAQPSGSPAPSPGTVAPSVSQTTPAA